MTTSSEATWRVAVAIASAAVVAAGALSGCAGGDRPGTPSGATVTAGTPGATAGTPGAVVGTPGAVVGTPGAVVSASPTPAGPTPTMDPTRQAFYEGFELPELGEPDAPVTVYEFSDYLCPFCRRHAVETAPELVREYVDAGRVKLVFYDYPIPSHGLPAVIAHESAHCAGEQDRYWPMHDALFARQDDLTGLPPGDEDAARDLVAAIGESIGASEAAMRSCLESQRYRGVLVGLSDAAKDRGVTVTPTLLVVGPGGQEVVQGYLPYADFRAYIERALGEGPATPAAAGTP